MTFTAAVVVSTDGDVTVGVKSLVAVALSTVDSTFVTSKVEGDIAVVFVFTKDNATIIDKAGCKSLVGEIKALE